MTVDNGATIKCGPLIFLRSKNKNAIYRLTIDASNGNGSPVMFQITEQCHGLYGLAQAHVVRQNTVDSIVHERHKPVQASNLIIAHFAIDE